MSANTLFFVLVIFCLLAISVSRSIPVSNRGLSSILAKASSVNVKGRGRRGGYEKVIEELTPTKGMFGRLPSLPKTLAFTGIESFFSTASVMVPIGLVMKGGVLIKDRKLKSWVVSGSQMGIEWGKISACFAAGDVLSSIIRGKEDRWNTVIGSGLASAALRINEGPVAIAQGFGMGCLFVYAIDQFMPQTNDVTGTGPQTQTTRRSNNVRSMSATAGAGTRAGASKNKNKNMFGETLAEGKKWSTIKGITV